MRALAAELSGIEQVRLTTEPKGHNHVATPGGQTDAKHPERLRRLGGDLGGLRLFDRPAVTAERILAPHIARPVESMGAHRRVLCLEDTREADCTGKSDMQGLGPLNYENRQGLYL